MNKLKSNRVRMRRLTGKKPFGRLFEAGTVVRSKHLMVRLLPNGMDAPRVTAIAAKRLGNAVKRNRLRRRLRAAALGVVESLPVADIGIFANGGVELQPFEELQREILNLVERAWEAAGND